MIKDLIDYYFKVPSYIRGTVSFNDYHFCMMSLRLNEKSQLPAYVVTEIFDAFGMQPNEKTLKIGFLGK